MRQAQLALGLWPTVIPRGLPRGAFTEGKNLSAREIAQAYGVPPMLVGVPGDATFSNYKEARYHLWEDTILPHLEMIKGELNQWLVPFFEEGLEFRYDAESISALAPKREALWAKVEKASFLTINEKRELVGYPPLSATYQERVIGKSADH